MSLGYPCIKYARRIYLSRTVEPITLESILNEYESNTINKKLSQPLEKLSIPFENSFNPENKTLRNLFKRGVDTVKVRVLSHVKLEKPLKMAISDTLLIHIHGGGFISMSSHSHQCYTRL